MFRSSLAFRIRLQMAFLFSVSVPCLTLVSLGFGLDSFTLVRPLRFSELQHCQFPLWNPVYFPFSFRGSPFFLQPGKSAAWFLCCRKLSTGQLSHRLPVVLLFRLPLSSVPLPCLILNALVRPCFRFPLQLRKPDCDRLVSSIASTVGSSCSSPWPLPGVFMARPGACDEGPVFFLRSGFLGFFF